MATTAGLQVANENQNLQIDSENVNVCLISKGTINNWAGTAPMISAQIPIPANGQFILFGQTAGRPVAVWTSGGNFVVRTNAVGSLDYYIFGLAPAVETGYGLQVFKEDGSLAYDSGNKHLRLLKIEQATSDAHAMSVATGKTIAAGLSSYGRRVVPTQQGQSLFYYIYLARSVIVSLAQVTLTQQQITRSGFVEGGLDAGTAYGPRPQLIAVDVTDF